MYCVLFKFKHNALQFIHPCIFVNSIHDNPYHYNHFEDQVKTWTQQPVPVMSGHSAHLTSLPELVHPWPLWRCTCCLILIVLRHREVISNQKETSCITLLNAGCKPWKSETPSRTCMPTNICTTYMHTCLYKYIHACMHMHAYIHTYVWICVKNISAHWMHCIRMSLKMTDITRKPSS